MPLSVAERGLGPDNKKWVGSEKEVRRVRQPPSEICAEYLVSVAFFRQVYEEKVFTAIQYIVFFRL